jgi:hypothetical protein
MRNHFSIYRQFCQAMTMARFSSLLGLFTLCLLLAGCGATSGPGLLSPVVWVQQYGAQQLQSSGETLGFGPEAATALAADSAGNVLVTGYVAGSFAGYTGDPGVIDAYLTKYGPDGTRLWLKQFPSPAGALLDGVTTDSSNNIIAIGAAFSYSGQSQAFVAKTDPNGNPLWYVALPAAVGGSFGSQVKAESDGSIIVAGFGFFDGSSQETLFAARLSGTDGHILWVNPYVLPSLGLLTGISLDASGNPLLIAVATTSDGNTYPYVAKLNQADGSTAWTHQITSTPNSVLPFSITSDSAGNPLVGGGVFAGPLDFGFSADPQEKATLYKFNSADGTEQWQKTYSTGKGDSITGVQTIANGTIYAVGYTNGQFNSYETPTALTTVFLLTLQSDGTLNAAHQFGSGPLANTTVPFGPLTTIDASGNVFVSGATTNAYPGFTNDAHALQMFIAKLKPAPLLQF